MWDDFKYVAHYRGDKRNYHDRQDNTRREHANTQGRPLEKNTQPGHAAQMLVDPGFHVLAKKRRENE